LLAGLNLILGSGCYHVLDSGCVHVAKSRFLVGVLGLWLALYVLGLGLVRYE
jgi:hypothetical protein